MEWVSLGVVLALSSVKLKAEQLLANSRVARAFDVPIVVRVD